MSVDKYPQLFSCQIGAIVYRALYGKKNSVEGSIVLFRGSYCCDALLDWPAAILDSRCRWTLGESLIHSQSDDKRSLNLDIEGLVSNKMHRLCRKTWRELFRFIAATVIRGPRSASTGK